MADMHVSDHATDLDELREQLAAAREVIAVLTRRLEQSDETTPESRFALHKAMANLENTIAERTRALAESESRYRALFEHSPDMLLVVDPEGVITAANRACGETLECAPESLHGRPLAAIFESGAGNHGSEWGEGERELPLVGGKTVAVMSAPLPGSPRSRLVSLRDVTAKRDLTRKLQHAERLAAIGNLAAGVAHEINNPLAVLQLGLEALLQSGQVRGDAHERLAQFAEHARRIARIVASLHDFARPRAPVREDVRVRGLIDAAIEASLPSTASVALQVDVRPIDLEVRVDQGQVEQAFVHLLTNAARAAGGGGRVSVSARRRDTMCVIRVLDDGPGVDLALVEDLRAPFGGGQVPSAGTGLSIAWGFVHENAGTLSAENRPGGGACFEIALPLSETVELPEEDFPSLQGRSLRVLCVEDEPALLSLLVAMLQDIGHTALAAESAERALEILARESVDAVLTDVHLPGQSGQVLEEAIRRTHPALGRRVILMSGMFHDARPGQRWLQKPFTFDALESALADL